MCDLAKKAPIFANLPRHCGKRISCRYIRMPINSRLFPKEKAKKCKDRYCFFSRVPYTERQTAVPAFGRAAYRKQERAGIPMILTQQDERFHGAEVLEVEAYGAAGDGTADDYAAVKAAIEAAKALPAAVIRFRKDAVYRLSGPEGTSVAMEIHHLKNCAFIGENTTLMLEGIIQYWDIVFCENILMQGFNLKFRIPPYTVSEVLEADYETMTVLVRTRDSLGITEPFHFGNGATFGLPMVDYARMHMHFRDILPVDPDKHLYRIPFTRGGDMLEERFHLLVENKVPFLTPMPRVGQIDSNAVRVMHTTNLTMRDVNLWNASHFNFHMRYNYGTFYFERVNLTPEPGTDGAMVGWRDGFHVKENRARFIWQDCVLEKVFDDVFNISCSLMTVNEVYSPTEFNMFCGEFGGGYPFALREGDELLLTNEQTGEFVGLTVIEKVVEQAGPVNRVIVRDPLPRNKAGEVMVSVPTVAAPGSEIRHCTVRGTFRFRHSLTVTDSDFTVIHGWIENEPIFEGPTPVNQYYKNCRMVSAKEGEKFISFGAVTLSGVAPEHRVKNVVFEDCDVDPDGFFIRPGNEIKFIQNGKVIFEETAEGTRPQAEKPETALTRLFTLPDEAPAFVRMPERDTDGCEAIRYVGAPYEGHNTEVFAYLGMPEGASEKHPVPGVLLVHGGGGTAFPEWVRRWNARGYAAIAMDLEGHIPTTAVEGKVSTLTHPLSGPVNTEFGDGEKPVGDQWMYHAVSAVLGAHALLRADARVLSDQIGMTGISWGGVIASIVLCVDDALAFAVPVYGCAHLAESRGYFADLIRKPGAGIWDCSALLPAVKVPTMWINGAQDVHFSPDATSLCCRETPGSLLCILPDHGHGHESAWVLGEPYAFADSICRGTPGFVRFLNHPRFCEHFSECQLAPGTLPVKRTVVYAKNGLQYDRAARTCSTEWEVGDTRPGPGQGVSGGFIPFDVPFGTKAFYLNVTDSRGLTVSGCMTAE